VRIAIDASTISTQGGPRTYVLGLLEALLQIDSDNDYVVFYNDESHMGRFPRAKEIVLTGKNPLARLWREHVLLPLACRRERIDLLHCPKSAIPFFSPCPVVVTLHDLIPLKHPETEKFAARLYWRLQIPIAARRSAFIITDSAHARQEIMADFKVAPEKIRAKYGLSAGYILYVGTIQPRKNLDTLIEAFSLLKSERRIDCKLVIVGRKGWLYDTLFARISELDLSNDVIFTGFVPDEELPFIYDGARVFAYLSLFEGFGLPPLEAMACGVPVVTSNTTSLPEVVGDAGIAVPPTAVTEVAEALLRVIEQDDIAAAMRAKGLARSRSFSWESAARETLAVYRSVRGKK